MFSRLLWTLLLAPLCWSRQYSIRTYKYTCSECDETLFLVTGTTDFIIHHCSTMCYCCPRSFDDIGVTWQDEHGHKGKVRNYMVSTKEFPDLSKPGQHKITTTHTYICIDDQESVHKFQADIILNVYDANVIIYEGDAKNHTHFVCSTGMSGEANDGISVLISFSDPSGDVDCSVQCGSIYKPHPPCDWNSVTWNESTGICTVTIDKLTPSDTGSYCCSVTSNATITNCENMSDITEQSITTNSDPTQTPVDHNNKTIIFIGCGVGGGILIIILMSGVAYYIWYRRRFPYINIPGGGAQCGCGGVGCGRPGCGGPMQ